jgi:signal transduction histidine kinase
VPSNEDRLAVLAHELRTPLSTLTNAAEWLERTAEHEPSIRRISAIVSRQTAVLRTLVEQLLDVGRLDMDRVQLRMRDVDVRAVASHAVEDRRREMERAGLTCELAPAPQPVVVTGDAVKLGQAMANLLSNAIKFTPPGGCVHIAVGSGGGSASICVRDSGVGIAPELLPVIFDRYRQGKRGSFGGLGLGLPIAKGIVELHGGEISAVSDGPGMGCEIRIRLPLARRADANV